MIYFVTFDTPAVIYLNEMIYHCEAKNAKEAKAKAKAYWNSLRGISGRMLHMYAKKSAVQDANLLRVRGWEGTEYRGQYVMGHVFCTASRVLPRRIKKDN